MDLAGPYPAASSASSSSLALVSRLLDITRSEQWRDLVSARGAAAETLEGKEKRRAKVATNLRLVEVFVSLMRVLADGGTALLARACAGFAEEVAGIRGKLQGELKGQVCVWMGGGGGDCSSCQVDILDVGISVSPFLHPTRRDRWRARRASCRRCWSSTRRARRARARAPSCGSTVSYPSCSGYGDGETEAVTDFSLPMNPTHTYRAAAAHVPLRAGHAHGDAAAGGVRKGAPPRGEPQPAGDREGHAEPAGLLGAVRAWTLVCFSVRLRLTAVGRQQQK